MMDEDEYREPDAGDDPALAFARVEDRLASVHGEVGLLRAAIGGLAATRESIAIPDYETTPARTEKVLGGMVQQVVPKSVVEGECVSGGVALGGTGIIQKNK